MILHHRTGFSSFLSLLLILFFFDALVAVTNTPSNNLFPLPKGLEPNVNFWKNIYAKYSERDVVIHDSYDLGIVYEVVNLDSLFKGVSVSSRLEWKKIERIKKQYKTILLRLSRKKNLRIESLRGKERYVATFFKSDLSSRRLRRAAYTIRAQTGLKERFKLGLQRSGLYLPYMRQIFLDAGLPLELLALPHVESSFNYKAYSKLGAAGIWQFTRPTGRSYMKISYEVDERLDPIRATESAAEHLKRNYRKINSWPLAITAYNHGLNGMLRAKRKFGDNIARIVKYYRSRSFGFASRNFYSEFLAALHVSENYRHYFGDIEFHRAKDFVTFKTPHYIKTRDLIEHFDLSVDEFAEFNPALRPSVLSSKRLIPKDFHIRIPFRDGLDVEAIYAKIAPERKFTEQIRAKWHKVNRGENLSAIARRYGVRISELMARNNIRNPHRIYVGQNLEIPATGKPVPISVVRASEATQHVQLAEATDLDLRKNSGILDVPQTFRVATATAEPADLSNSESENPVFVKDGIKAVPVKPKREQNLAHNKQELTPIEIKRLENRIESIEDVMAMALPEYYVELTKDMEPRVVRAPKFEMLHDPFRDIDFPENGQVRVEPDETLGHFADWLSVPTQKLRRINGFAYGTALQIDQPVWLTFENVTPEEFHSRRVEYHQGIEEDFYQNFSVEGQTSHKIKPGESIWLLCNRTFEIPYWLLKKYNQKSNLLNLAAGDEIIVPLVERRPQSSL